MKLFKSGCAFLALLYLVYVLLPAHFITPNQDGVKQITPEWFNRSMSAAFALFFGAIFYGIHRRTLFYWKLIPFIVGILLLSFWVPTFLIYVRPSPLPWVPKIIYVAMLFVFFFVFIVWWRGQRDYFSPRRNTA